MVLFLKIYPEIKCTAKTWADLCNFYSKVIFFFLNFCIRHIFFFFFFFFSIFFVEFELLVFHNIIVKISEKKKKKKKIEPAELVEKLPPSYLPYRFLYNMHSFLIWGKGNCLI